MNLLQYLYRQAGAPEYQIRLKWRQNTVALWDNRAVVIGISYCGHLPVP
ncbi:TauD/TfdA family dioxygenase [Cupriavidus consociatus]